ncbi:MAG TPA: PadR family transcriptional regulator [Thermotogota bacterium]|nr:PadR family transcriptional regulator [Thermotogota bacterium]HRW91487.1 PadR family transcriptional regulator [Thermotogota bacterium]
MGKRALQSLCPLTETTFFILLALTEPLHGYGIMQKVSEMSDGRVNLGPGTLYGALSKLEKLGAITFQGEDPENPRRKVYQVSEEGKQILQIETRRIAQMASVATGILEREEQE